MLFGLSDALRQEKPAASLRLLAGGLVALCASLAHPAGAQSTRFGSSDDPSEHIQPVWWAFDSHLDVFGGLSLIGSEVRGAAAFRSRLITRPVLAQLDGTVRAGYAGEYGPDWNEAYDVLRLLTFARLNAPPEASLYARAGLLNRMRLGNGHVVNFYNSAAAWDQRTVGFEGRWRNAFVTVAGFTDNVLFDGIAGGHAAVRPLAASADPRVNALELGFSYARDLATPPPGTSALAAYHAEASFDVVRPGEIYLKPFASYAWYDGYGHGVGFGATVGSSNFIDLARFRIRLGLLLSSDEFIPGYIGAFYPVQNARARILDADAYLGGTDTLATQIVGVTLAEARSSNALLTEVRLLLFDWLEFWYDFRRHYGPQDLSEMHLRLFMRTAEERLEVSFGLDRGGLRSFFSVFGSTGDQTVLSFDVYYRLARSFVVFVNARYTYEQVANGPDGTAYYLVQRRFEPFLGYRIRF